MPASVSATVKAGSEAPSVPRWKVGSALSTAVLRLPAFDDQPSGNTRSLDGLGDLGPRVGHHLVGERGFVGPERK